MILMAARYKYLALDLVIVQAAKCYRGSVFAAHKFFEFKSERWTFFSRAGGVGGWVGNVWTSVTISSVLLGGT